jgi:hypothetical protein
LTNSGEDIQIVEIQLEDGSKLYLNLWENKIME